MQKKVVLTEQVKGSDGKVVATLQANLLGDGSTPEIMAFGNGMSGIIGYRDDGSVILDNSVDLIIDEAKKSFMAKAIEEQKKLCVENGVDPDLVNIIGLEKKESNKNE